MFFGISRVTAQIRGDFRELGERGFEILDDLRGDHVWRREVGGVFEGFVLEPKDIEVDLVALDQLVIGKAFEALAFRPLVPVFGVIASDEIV